MEYASQHFYSFRQRVNTGNFEKSDALGMAPLSSIKRLSSFGGYHFAKYHVHETRTVCSVLMAK